VNAEIAPQSVFSRKNYFYPDLPKGYQISQFELPIVGKGELIIDLEAGSKTIGITRAHLEEDAGKSLHEDFAGMTGIDLNRAGTPLLEIVSEPEMSSAKEAVAYMRKIHSIVRYLQISDGNMQEGSFRCDANVSVRRTGEKELGTRTEIKNLNSFRFVERAINHEVERQIDVIESGGRIVQETRLYDADDDSTRPMRSKEEANDYRYFPDPDLLPVVIEEALLVEVKAQMPELPHVRSLRYQDSYGLALEEAQQLTVSQEGAAYFDAVVAIVPESAKLIANWVCGDLAAKLKQDELSIEQSPVNAEAMVQLIQRIADGTISGKTAKDVFQAMWTSQASADDIIQQQGLQQISDVGELEALVAQVVEDNPKQVEQYLSGKDKVFGFFVGKLMQMTKGKANPQQVTDLLKAKLVRD